MKVIAIFPGNYPNGGPMSKRLHLYCKGLIEEGHEAKIIIPIKTVNFGNQFSHPGQKGVHEGVEYEYLFYKNVRSKHFIVRRFEDFLGFFLLTIRLLKKSYRVDILFLIDIRNWTPIIFYLITRITGAKMIYEINEHPLILTSKLKYWLDQKIIYPLYDGFTVISQPLFNLMEKIKRRNAKILIVPILTEAKKISTSFTSGKELKSPYVFHSGGLIDSKDGISGMIKAVGLVNNHFKVGLNFYLTGSLKSNPEHNQYNTLIRELGISEKVKFLGFLPEDELLYHQKNCLLAIINKSENLQNSYCLPTKIGEYFSLGKPVIVTNVGNITKYVEDNITAYIVSPDRPDLIAEKIIEIISDPTTCVKIGQNGKALANSIFNYQVQAKYLSKFFTELVTPSL